MRPPSIETTDLPLAILSTKEIEITLASSNPSRAIPLLDQRNCQEIASYFVRRCNQPELSIEELQAALNEIAKQTGKKPAVVYTLARLDQLELMAVTLAGQPLHIPIRGLRREQLLQTAIEFTNSVRDPRYVNTRAAALSVVNCTVAASIGCPRH